MANFLTLLAFLLGAFCAQAQLLYIKTFGDPAHKPIVFLHGGPGGSMLDFELTTAQTLADKGYFVIAYDRRGEGRSEDDSAKFTYAQTLSDITDLYKTYKLKSATLVGHSFGGIAATLFADQHPEKVDRIILAGTPVSLQQSFKTILQKVTTIAESKKDTATLHQVSIVREYDHASIYYSSGCFMLAMQNGFYNTKNPNVKAQELYALLMNSQAMKDYTKFLTDSKYKTMFNATMGFWKNEAYTSIDITNTLAGLKSKGVAVCGIYGKEDGLFDDEHIQTIQKIVRDTNHFAYLDDCSHGVFMDQQEIFLTLLQNWIR